MFFCIQMKINIEMCWQFSSNKKHNIPDPKKVKQKNKWNDKKYKILSITDK